MMKGDCASYVCHLENQSVDEADDECGADGYVDGDDILIDLRRAL